MWKAFFSFAFFARVFAAGPVVVQTDFGLKDAAVCSMKAVMYRVSSTVRVVDITHEISPFNVWEASYRLAQTAPFWPAGTVFISVVDPSGKISKVKPVVAKSKTGQYFLTPDNGTLTLIEDQIGLSSVRVIDTVKYNFSGANLYAHVGALLASGKIKFEDAGTELKHFIEKISYERSKIADGVLSGNINMIDTRFGDVWTNISKETVKTFNMELGKSYKVEIYKDRDKVFSKNVTYYQTFGEAERGKELLYLNSMQNLAIAISMGDFAKTYEVSFDPVEWKIFVRH